MAPGRQESSGSRSKSSRGRDRLALAFGRGQRQLLTATQLQQRIGFSPGAVQHRIEAGRLFTVFAGVYSLSPPPFPAEQRLLAATLACGPGTVVSDGAAGWLHGFRPSPSGPIDVISPTGSGRSRRGIQVHRRDLDPLDATRRRGLPCTSPTRTIIDLAASVSLAELEQILLLADSRGLIDGRRLRTLVRERRGRPGAPRLRTVLGFGEPFVRSPIEVLYRQICRRIGVEEPLVNQPVVVGDRTFEVDFHWPRLRLIVEVDGYAFHGGRSRANADSDRDQRLAIAGWNVHRFTRDQVVGDPGEVERRTVALIRRAELGG